LPRIFLSEPVLIVVLLLPAMDEAVDKLHPRVSCTGISALCTGQ
jgi:hypothetical protein